MPKRNSPERKAMLAARRHKQRNAIPTARLKKHVNRSKYIPAGPRKNIPPGNR